MFESKKKILDLLKNGPRTPTEIADKLGLAQSTVSQHLKELTEIGQLESLPDEHFKNIKYFKITEMEPIKVTANSGQKGMPWTSFFAIIILAIAVGGGVYFLAINSHTSAGITVHLNQSDAASLIGAGGSYVTQNASSTELRRFSSTSGVSEGYVTQYNLSYNGSIRSLNEQIFIAANPIVAYQNLLQEQAAQLNATSIQKAGGFNITVAENATLNGMLYSYGSYSYYSKGTDKKSVPSTELFIVGVNGREVFFVNVSQVNSTRNINATDLANLMYDQLNLLYSTGISSTSSISTTVTPTQIASTQTQAGSGVATCNETETLYVGENLTCGQFTVELTGLGTPNYSGASTASVEFFNNGEYTNATRLNPNSTVIFDSLGSRVEVNVTFTNNGTYSYQRWAVVSLAPIIVASTITTVPYITTATPVENTTMPFGFPLNTTVSTTTIIPATTSVFATTTVFTTTSVPPATTSIAPSYSCNSINTVYVGGNLTCGQFTVELTDIGEANSNGVSPAVIDLFYNDTLTNQTLIFPGYTIPFNVTGNLVNVSVTQTSGVNYAYLEWAKIEMIPVQTA